MIRLLASSDVVLSLPWHDVSMVANSGVKRGATECPAIFSRLSLVDEILCAIQLQHEGEVVEGMGCDGSCFMDDVLTWKRDVPSFQKFVDQLLPKLAVFGLRVQPSKSKLLCLRGNRMVSLRLLGWACCLLTIWKISCTYASMPSLVSKPGMSDIGQVVRASSVAENVACLASGWSQLLIWR